MLVLKLSHVSKKGPWHQDKYNQPHLIMLCETIFLTFVSSVMVLVVALYGIPCESFLWFLNISIIAPWEIWTKIETSNLEASFSKWWLRYILWNCHHKWISLDLADIKSISVQVTTWCRQATSHYLSQCWPRFVSPYCVTRPRFCST